MIVFIFKLSMLFQIIMSLSSSWGFGQITDKSWNILFLKSVYTYVMCICPSWLEKEWNITWQNTKWIDKFFVFLVKFVICQTRISYDSMLYLWKMELGNSLVYILIEWFEKETGCFQKYFEMFQIQLLPFVNVGEISLKMCFKNMCKLIEYCQRMPVCLKSFFMF